MLWRVETGEGSQCLAVTCKHAQQPLHQNWETPQAQEVAAIVDALTWTKGTRGAAESGRAAIVDALTWTKGTRGAAESGRGRLHLQVPSQQMEHY
jgi:hypothetical protein